MSGSQLLASEADCPGAWILQAALTRTEAGAFFALGGQPNCTCVRDSVWNIKTVCANDNYADVESEQDITTAVSNEALQIISKSLKFSYPFYSATQIPSKLTATQLKGRLLDEEISEGTEKTRKVSFRKAGSMAEISGTSYGNAIHSVLQHIHFSRCESVDAIRCEVSRLEQEKRISSEQAVMVDAEKLFRFFDSPLGRKIRNCNNVLREFKFSILDDASKYYPDASNEKILLQGVVDCALIEDDGITVLDFKTDRITGDTLDATVQKYKSQVCAYANALTRIYKKPIQSALLYFFELNQFVEVM